MLQESRQKSRVERERVKLRFRIAWSKVTKRYDAEPVLEKKNHSYLREMVEIPLSTRRVINQ
ncbi:hypothetical protein OS493_022440 [Desmophyllum pertusum]|uniref:Uncharacterized protein n=1 Tax=Desmophyllum pertusum TaxID=174260 RepID=A0A9W9ZMB7_9CNID|nr:hypothetical protein OS493_022440 [Desmophyllum pertusum]